MQTPPATRPESGFTLIELLVGMFLGAIVIAMVIGLVVNVFSSGDRSKARTKSQRSAFLAADQLQSDIRATRAPQRKPYFTGSPDRFRAMLLRDDNPDGYQVHDVLAATGSSLTFYAEVNRASADVECVTWTQQADGSLRRVVRAYNAGCTGGGGAVLQDKLLVEPLAAQAAGGAAPPAPFSYRRLVQPSPMADPLDPDACTAVQSPSTSTTLERDQITAVMLDLRAFVASRDGHGDQQLQTTVAIGSRQGIEYRYAIGCAA
ncbi:MAG: prepilin-type N-terminal cleavage/methylation domain-containing protein [Thermoleophilia bacterium]|nr:prepilin-type N-terminal cleavage/methylation domain-containing protein [Thermoleophilia bacterium]